MTYIRPTEGIKSLGLMPSFPADVSKSSRQLVQQGLTMPKVRTHPDLSSWIGLKREGAIV